MRQITFSEQRETINTRQKFTDTEPTKGPAVKEGDRGGPSVTATPPYIGITASKAIPGQAPSASSELRPQRSWVEVPIPLSTNRHRWEPILPTSPTLSLGRSQRRGETKGNGDLAIGDSIERERASARAFSSLRRGNRDSAGRNRNQPSKNETQTRKCSMSCLC